MKGNIFLDRALIYSKKKIYWIWWHSSNGGLEINVVLELNRLYWSYINQTIRISAIYFTEKNSHIFHVESCSFNKSFWIKSLTVKINKPADLQGKSLNLRVPMLHVCECLHVLSSLKQSQVSWDNVATTSLAALVQLGWGPPSFLGGRAWVVFVLSQGSTWGPAPR